MSEDRIEIARAVNGDRAALDALLRRHLDDLYRFCLRLMWSDDVAARDLAQETLVQAISGIGTFRAESLFRTWLFAIAFIITSLTLTIFSAQNSADSSIIEQLGGTAPAEESGIELPPLNLELPPAEEGAPRAD